MGATWEQRVEKTGYNSVFLDMVEIAGNRMECLYTSIFAANEPNTDSYFLGFPSRGSRVRISLPAPVNRIMMRVLITSLL